MRKVKTVKVLAGICLLFFVSGFFTGKKEVRGEDKLWRIRWEEEEFFPYFRKSTVMSIYLNQVVQKEDVKIFVNGQQRTAEWNYGQNAKIYFDGEGIYHIRVEHESGAIQEETIYVELTNPGPPRISCGEYEPGTWTSKTISLCAYGRNTVSGKCRYEYRMGNGAWERMPDGKIQIKENMDDMIYIRGVSKAGRQGEIAAIRCRLWKTKPKVPQIVHDMPNANGWFAKIPQIGYKTDDIKGPQTDVVFSLFHVTPNRQYQTKNRIPEIKEDGIYYLKAKSMDEAGNESDETKPLILRIDRCAPKITVHFQNPPGNSRVLKEQTAAVSMEDDHLDIRTVQVETSGKQGKWRKKGNRYVTEIVFKKEGEQFLKIKGADKAGNEAQEEVKKFLIDRTGPEIQMKGIKNHGSYGKNVFPKIYVHDKNAGKVSVYIQLNQKKWKPAPIQKDGYYMLCVTARDRAGNTTRKNCRFHVNKEGVRITFSDCKMNGEIINQKEFYPGFRVKSREPVHVEGFIINGQFSDYVWKENYLYTRYPLKDNGKYRIFLKVRDAAGKRAVSDTAEFIYDTKKPYVVIYGMDKKERIPYGKDIIVEVQKKGDLLQNVSVDQKTIAANKERVVLKYLPAGSHVLTIKAKDAAGNYKKEKRKIYVTKIMPKMPKRILTTSKTEIKNTMYKKMMIFFLIVLLAVILKNRRTRL